MAAKAINEEKVVDTGLEASVVELLLKKGYTITTAESCTGGLVSATIVNVPGSSSVFNQAFVTYANEAKRKALGVKKSTLKKYGAVSKKTAKEMALGALKAAKADIAVATTGIAGPGGGTEEKPVGLVYIACAVGKKVTVKKCQFDGSRSEVRKSTVETALTLVKECLQKETKKAKNQK